MVARTIQIQGSDEVMAMFGKPGEFYRGKWQNVRVTKSSEDEDTSREVRDALVGLIIPTIFTKESIEKQTGIKLPIPRGSRLAYSVDVVNVLKSARKHREAEQLRSVSGNPLDMYTIDPDSYELVPDVQRS